jgi:hypothetical protein
VVKFSAACAYGEAGTVSDGRKGKELECRYHVDVGCTVPGNFEVQHGAREQSRGFTNRGLVGAWGVWGGGGLTGVQEHACAPARRRGSVAAAETGFVLRRGQLNSMGSGHCFFTAERFA